MSTVIELEFETQIDLDFIEQGIAVHLIRLIASVQLQTTEGWTNKYKALVDTGNPLLYPMNQHLNLSSLCALPSALCPLPRRAL